MFPPSIPHTFIEWLTRPGDVVYDCFSGRGTTALEACLLGRTGVGLDANPLAHLLTGAKVDPPTQRTVMRRLTELGSQRDLGDPQTVPEQIRMLFDRQVLAQLVWLRNNLDLSKRADRYILGVLLGQLHRNANRNGEPLGLTVAMPNAFAMSPDYVARYIGAHGLVPPRVDVVDFLRERAVVPDLPSSFRRGRSFQADAATQPPSWLRRNRAKLIFFSPPYLEVISYGKYNWIRLWLLGATARDVDSRLFRSQSVVKYVPFMESVFRNARAALRDDGYLCVVAGDVTRGDTDVCLADLLTVAAKSATDLTPAAVLVDQLPTQHKVSRIWGEAKGRAIKTDRIVIFSAPAAERVGSIPAIDWSAGG